IFTQGSVERIVDVSGTYFEPGQVHWIANVGGDWTAGSNWSTGTVPEPSDDVFIEPSSLSHLFVTSSADETVNSLSTAAGTSLAIDGGTLTLTDGTGDGVIGGEITVGSFSGATLRIGGTFDNTPPSGLSGAVGRLVIGLYYYSSEFIFT